MRGEREAHEGGVICILTVIHDVVQQEKNKNKNKKKQLNYIPLILTLRLLLHSLGWHYTLILSR